MTLKNLEKSIWDVKPEDIYIPNRETILVIFWNQPAYPSHVASTSDNRHITTMEEAEEAIRDIQKCMDGQFMYSHWVAVLIRDGLTERQCNDILKETLAKWMAISIGLTSDADLKLARNTINLTMRRMRAPLN